MTSYKSERQEIHMQIDAIVRAIPQHFLLDPPDGGDVTVAEGVQRMAARIEQLEREKAVVSDALQQQSDLNLKYTLEYNEMVAERNEFAARIEQLEAALEWIVGTALTEPEAMVEKARAALEERT